ncbi:MAG: exonuclease domain-containing protein [Clostridium fessum]
MDKFSTFVNPEVPIPYDIEQLTSINDGMVISAPTIEEVLPEFLAFCEGAVMVAHNASFDISFIKENARRQGLTFQPTVLDTVSLARVLLPNLNRFKLDTVAKELKISLENHHRAVDDAGATAEIFVKFIEMLKARDIENLTQLNELSKMTPEMIRKMPTYHIIILAKNDVGRINLYRLISQSNLTYFARTSADSEESAGEPPRGADSLARRARRESCFRRSCAGFRRKNWEKLQISTIIWKCSRLETTHLCCGMRKVRSSTWEDLQDLNRKDRLNLANSGTSRSARPAMSISSIRRMRSTAVSSWRARALRMQTIRHHCICGPPRKCWGNLNI